MPYSRANSGMASASACAIKCAQLSGVSASAGQHAWCPEIFGASDSLGILKPRSGMSAIPWETKTPTAFWRGTDRGAVNWAWPSEGIILRRSRQRFVAEACDKAF